ncbi:conserved hypothetical protein [Paecilomyces variotii No. 5]|uniref:Uncharacterized protein n=1 Tax=Byssochlamys spectabilis (strain No. 5 / NBRC 109023) TaxID=1356009 RepID=V5FJM4_BYSSN|nr:conserved hypothetical protein [Paecilomyces variotii No. 5]
MFSPDDLYNHALEILSNATLHQELIYKDVPPPWAHTVLDRLDEEFEGRFRKHYNSITSTIWIRVMPTELFNCHQPWTFTEKARWYRVGLAMVDEDEHLNFGVGTTTRFVDGPYAGSSKEPDLYIRPDNQRLPSLVMESGWSESLSWREDDMNIWLVGGQGQVKATIILNWQRVTNTDTVRGSVYLYTLDTNGTPRLKQSITVFPAPPPAQAAIEQLVLSRGEIFGGDVFQDRNLNDVLPFSVGLLRQKAANALVLMHLVPA